MGKGDDETGFVELQFIEVPEGEMLTKAIDFYRKMDRRRTTRHFSDREVPRELIELAIKTAGTAPSGAHLQPWTFVAISDSLLKGKIREAAEEEEKKFYEEKNP